MKRFRDFLVTSVVAIEALSASRVLAVTRAANNVFGSYDKSPAELTIGEIEGQFVAGKVWTPHSAIYAWNGTIRDDEFNTLLVNNLGAGDNRKHDSLLINLNQCFGGGFIDDIEATMNTTMITTAAKWNSTAGFDHNDITKSFAYQWEDQFAIPAPNPQVNDTKMRSAYSAATVADPYRNSERPQYYSTSDFMDNDRIGSSPDKKYALLFVGNDSFAGEIPGTQVRYPVSWDLGVRMYDRLIARGYDAANIYVYYSNFDGADENSNGKPPGAVGDMPVDGPATVEKFKSFFNDVVGLNVADRNDQVFVWVDDHGIDAKEFTGKVKFTPINNMNRITMRLELTPDSLLAMRSTIGFGPTVQLFGEPVTNFTGPITVQIGDSFGNNMNIIGAILNDQAWHLDIQRTIFDTLAQNMDALGDITLSFSGGGSITELNNFTLSNVASLVDLPETSAHLLLAFGCLFIAAQKSTSRAIKAATATR